MCYQLIRKGLFSLDPEIAHKFTLNTLKASANLGLTACLIKPIVKPVNVMGLEFVNPVGLAAGLDKNADYVDALAALGFGFLEIGSIVPNPQIGNPQPRLFRLPKHEALINRMGFNSKGLDYFITQLQKTKYKGVLGISISANSATPSDKVVDDYLTCLAAVYSYASYISLDISCPNVANQTGIFSADSLQQFLVAMKNAQTALAEQHKKYVPLAVKVSPDMSEAEIAAMVPILIDTHMDGVIATNTTRARPNLVEDPIAQERGGLSGNPLFPQALKTVQQFNALLQGKLPIIAVGGIMTADDALAMQQAGASLVQIYTGLIYRGPKLIREIAEKMT